MFAELTDSKLAENAPELVAILLIIGGVFAGVWRLIAKLQEGQERVVDKFLVHIRDTEERQEEIAAGNRATLEKVQASLDRNTLMLGQTGGALERATHVIERLERQTKTRDDE